MPMIYDALVKLGAAHPELRGSIRPLLKVAALGETYVRRLHNLDQEYLTEVVGEAKDILANEGARILKVDDGHQSKTIRGTYEGTKFQVTFGSPSEGQMYVFSILDGGARAAKKLTILSMSPMNVASETLYRHHGNGGFLD